VQAGFMTRRRLSGQRRAFRARPYSQEAWGLARVNNSGAW
jgi:hypothetical protein